MHVDQPRYGFRLTLAVLAPALAVAAATTSAQAPAPTVSYKIVTASERGTYIQIGRDLARFVAPQAGIQLEAMPSKGSADNVSRLRYDTNVKLAIVQSDVYQAFLDYAAKDNLEAAALIRPLRVVLPLYDEEIYFVVRTDSPLQYVHEIKDRKMNIGPLQSGTAMSASTIYRLMFRQPLPDANVTTLSNEEAIRSASYPNWLDQDVNGLAVKSYLVTYDYNYRVTVDHLAALARSLCQNFQVLQTEGHPKWRDVRLALPPLGRGWTYYAPMERVLRSCQAPEAIEPAAGRASSPARDTCSQQERILGLCKPQ
jgi:hypothetical protein